MHRICKSLNQHKYNVLLVGRQQKNSELLLDTPYQTHRLQCFFSKGILFYLEYNVRLFFFLLKEDMDIINSVDLDTLAAGRLASWSKRCQFTFDAHELFTEVPELQGKPIRTYIWKSIERMFIRGNVSCYTVNQSLAQIFHKRTKKVFEVVQNYPVHKHASIQKSPTDSIELVYQGMLNIGRGLEELIAAIGSKKAMRLHIIGRGDLNDKIAQLSSEHENIILHGFVNHEDLPALTSQCHIGLNLLSAASANYYYSSANKFFDFIMADIPVITMNFPEYRRINENFKVAELLDDLTIESITQAIDNIKYDYESYASSCRAAKEVYNWESQESTLFTIYDSLTDK